MGVNKNDIPDLAEVSEFAYYQTVANFFLV